MLEHSVQEIKANTQGATALDSSSAQRVSSALNTMEEDQE
jgi:hypothetical protein